MSKICKPKCAPVKVHCAPKPKCKISLWKCAPKCEPVPPKYVKCIPTGGEVA